MYLDIKLDTISVNPHIHNDVMTFSSAAWGQTPAGTLKCK